MFFCARGIAHCCSFLVCTMGVMRHACRVLSWNKSIHKAGIKTPHEVHASLDNLYWSSLDRPQSGPSSWEMFHVASSPPCWRITSRVTSMPLYPKDSFSSGLQGSYSPAKVLQDVRHHNALYYFCQKIKIEFLKLFHGKIIKTGECRKLTLLTCPQACPSYESKDHGCSSVFSGLSWF